MQVVHGVHPTLMGVTLGWNDGFGVLPDGVHPTLMGVTLARRLRLQLP